MITFYNCWEQQIQTNVDHPRWFIFIYKTYAMYCNYSLNNNKMLFLLKKKVHSAHFIFVEARS